MNTQQRIEIDRFITQGEYDNSFSIWSGNTFMDQAVNGSRALKEALSSEVLTRSAQVPVLTYPDSRLNINARAKFTPIVEGLFPRGEQSIVLDMLEKSVIFLTPATIETVLQKSPWLHTAWDLANMYLTSIRAKALSDTEQVIVGLSEEMTCYVSMSYFVSNDRFEDYVIHEATHIFHNCKRKIIELADSRRREWLLEIDCSKRETFAYACEAYSRILVLGATRAERSKLLVELIEGSIPAHDRFDEEEYVDILQEAVAARNGWKRILARCSPGRP